MAYRVVGGVHRTLTLKADGATEEWTLYGARGEKIGVYQWSGVYGIYDNTGSLTGERATFLPASDECVVRRAADQ